MMKSSFQNPQVLPAQGQRVRLHVLADLHQECGAVAIPQVAADVIALAGDISQGERGLQWIRERWPDRSVVYVMGNHEFYCHEFPDLVEMMHQQAADPNVQVLENQAVEIQGVTFLGCTLWTGFAEEADTGVAQRRVRPRGASMPIQSAPRADTSN